LTDLKDFYFLRYDGSKFAIYENEIIVSTRFRSAFLDGMKNGEHIHSPFDIAELVNYPVVSEHLFSVILEGYISTLNAIEARSKTRGASVGEPSISTLAV
jgi:hypothetical protein